MEIITKLVLAILASNPTFSLIFLVCFLAIFALPSIIHYLAVKDVVKELKSSIDRVDKRLDDLVGFILKNLKVKKEDDEDK